jgi:pimeloyl-ACP methyl ester carboxylesterase
MGADERVFAAQKQALPSLIVPRWIAPEADETIAHYAERFAGRINPGVPCFIGGASFGGFVALEMVRHLNPRGCFLIGSARSPADFPPAFRTLRKISCVAGAVPFELANLLSKVALLSSGGLLNQHSADLLSQMAESDAAFLRWACRAVLEWAGPSPQPTCPIFQIHGEKDFVLPVSPVAPDVIVTGAGHALSMSHPQSVTDFLTEKMATTL